jgi:hypothetical protein
MPDEESTTVSPRPTRVRPRLVTYPGGSVLSGASRLPGGITGWTGPPLRLLGNEVEKYVWRTGPVSPPEPPTPEPQFEPLSLEPQLEASPESTTTTKRRKLPRRIVKAAMERDAYRCRHCETWKDLTVDHIIPLCMGGADDLENLQTLCQPCNSMKGKSMPPAAVAT